MVLWRDGVQRRRVEGCATYVYTWKLLYSACHLAPLRSLPFHTRLGPRHHTTALAWPSRSCHLQYLARGRQLQAFLARGAATAAASAATTRTNACCLTSAMLGTSTGMMLVVPALVMVQEKIRLCNSRSRRMSRFVGAHKSGYATKLLLPLRRHATAQEHCVRLILWSAANCD